MSKVAELRLQNILGRQLLGNHQPVGRIEEFRARSTAARLWDQIDFSDPSKPTLLVSVNELVKL